jgi:hypothetical protein
MASPCKEGCKNPVEYRVTAQNGDPANWEAFACDEDLAGLVRVVRFRGYLAVVNYFGPVSPEERAEAIQEAKEDADAEAAELAADAAMEAQRAQLIQAIQDCETRAADTDLSPSTRGEATRTAEELKEELMRRDLEGY